jgi:hypothetical protein
MAPNDIVNAVKKSGVVDMPLRFSPEQKAINKYNQEVTYTLSWRIPTVCQ